MRRRKFVSAACVLGTAGFAGCAGILGNSGGERDQLEQRLEEQQDRNQNLEAQLEDHQSRVQELEDELEMERATIEDQQNRIDELEADLDSARESRRSTFVDYYEIAQDLYWDSADRFGEAEGHRNNENWAFAARIYFRTAPRFEDAAILWAKVEEHVADSGSAEAKELAATAAAAAQPAFEACELLGEGCWEMAQGKESEAESTFEEAQQPRQAAIEREPKPLEEFELALQ